MLIYLVMSLASFPVLGNSAVLLQAHKSRGQLLKFPRVLYTFAMNCPETVIIRGDERVSWGDRWVWRGAILLCGLASRGQKG